MSGIKNWWMNGWNKFAGKHPKLAKWIRQDGLFLIFSFLVTVWQFILLQFLPGLFSAYADVGWGWPGVEMTLFGKTFTWNVIGYAAEDGGLAYLFAYLIATFTAQAINFPLQRNITYRSKGNVAFQIMWYFITWVLVTCLVNSINCIWVALAKDLVPAFIYNLVTILITGGLNLIIFYFVFKIIFPEGKANAAA